MKKQGAGHGGVYLIMVRDFVVSEDLEGAVREFDPSAVILVANSVGEAMSQVRGKDHVAFAFIEASPRADATAQLDGLIREGGGRVVLLGADAEDEWETGRPADRWPTLLRPFTSQTVVSMLIANGDRTA